MTTNSSIKPAGGISWRTYLALCKLKVVGHIVFTAIIGMFLAVPGVPPLATAFWASLGIGFAAASAAALNHFLDRHADAEMVRTQNRPLPSGDIRPAQVVGFALLLGILAMAILIAFVNLLTAFLTFLSLIGYAVIYTVYLKRATPQNIVIGGAAGAAPPVLGWCAITGTVHPYALLLFLLIFVWTPPHFWAYAIAKRDDYAKVDIPMLPVTHGIAFTQLHILLYTILLFLAGLMPYVTGMSGEIYLAAAVIFGGIFVYYAIRLKRKADPRLAMQTFAYSLVYLVGIFTALLVDHYVVL
ncbi:heme o synthase [Methylococcus geothermalis]|uniref:Protoheme IX farnesyltransferase n=1 Tax=Methylococcus geothermalis TaxID=2681310 RepID=A0A858Q589_9GAMM|nr:heme o synthase [Methylococcus geothermalis]QJD28975.1 protoheme IX farnesyltransferase [Methylococcus geothermalis]